MKRKVVFLTCDVIVLNNATSTRSPPAPPHKWGWWTLPTIARCGEMIIESSGTIMGLLTGSLALTDFPGCITWAAPVDASPRYIVDARNRDSGSAAIRALPVSRDPFVLSWKDSSSMHQCSCFNESSSHIWTTCVFFPPTNFDGELHITSGKCLWWRDYWHLRTRFWTLLQHGLMALVSLLLIIQTNLPAFRVKV